jgi:uncharacterized protein YbjT (DUF2867 family)
MQPGERELHLGLDARHPSDATLRGVLGDVVQQRRLADPRLAAQDLHRALPRADALQLAVQHLALVAAASKHGAVSLCHVWRCRPVLAAARPTEGNTMKIVVIGGTGLIGSKLVTKLGEKGHEAIAASPDTGVNTLTGEGLAEAFEGAQVVVDVSNSPSFEDAAVLEFFETSTRNLLAAEAAAGVGHHVALSVVGTQRLLESGYFRAKIAQEKLIEQSSIPYSIVHATQFYEFVNSITAEATDGDTVRLAHVLIQPIAADDVATSVGEVAVGAPVNGIVEVAGPEQYYLDELIRQALGARNDPREVIADPHARYFGAELSERTLVPGDEARLGEIRFGDWSSQATRA